MRIFMLLFLLFPLAELFLLIKVGSEIGALATILLL
ncbi:MAG TPA: membrane protein FxsA, partial [Pseudomonas sp.]|nr:membrane protein FxsA [Pseudomonas sp.]